MSLSRAEMIAKLREILGWGASTSSDRELHHQWIWEVADALEQDQRELMRVRDEVGRAIDRALGVMDEHVMYERAEVLRTLRAWADALTKLIGDH